MVSLRGSMSRFRWKPNPYRDQSNCCLQKRIWMTIVFISLCRRRKQRLCKDGKTKKGEGRETCQMRLAIIIRWKLVHIQRLWRWRCDENLTKENSLVFFPGDHPCSNQPCPTELSFSKQRSIGVHFLCKPHPNDNIRNVFNIGQTFNIGETVQCSEDYFNWNNIVPLFLFFFNYIDVNYIFSRINVKGIKL